MTFGEDLESGARAAFRYVAHPHVAARKLAGPVRVKDQHAAGINGRIALRLTALVGTMQAAYAFTVLALLALPSVLGFNWFPSRTLLIVGWISQTMIQLVMLAVLQLGQNLQAAASDKRAESTFLDAEAIIQAAAQIAEHLGAQDAHLHEQDTAVAGILTQVQQILTHLAPPGSP
jgi:hypothetical protein